MTYLVNVLTQAGHVREIVVHAADRQAAIQHIEARGGRVLSVWNVTGDVEAEA